jgi:hypothetical protein
MLEKYDIDPLIIVISFILNVVVVSDEVNINWADEILFIVPGVTVSDVIVIEGGILLYVHVNCEDSVL